MGQSRDDNGLPSGLRRQLDAWLSAYCPDCHRSYPISQDRCEDDGSPLRQHSAVFPVAPFDSGANGSSPSGSCEVCGAFLLPGMDCSHGGSGGSDGAGAAGEAGEPGRLLGGKWRLLERLGGGTFGEFWLGEHHILGMKVGIKVLRRYLTATAGGKKLFHKEAMRVSLLNHPGIVKLFDYGEDESAPYLVMEYLRGRPLHEYLGGRLELEEYIEVICQATKALITAHRGTFTDGQPLVHLDLKPEHIFLEEIQGSWHVKVIDFGLAEITAGAMGNGAPAGNGAGGAAACCAGTLPYMGPERFRGIADPRSDIYSLGVILYECVADRRPFHGDSTREFREAHETVIPDPPSRRARGTAGKSLRRLDGLILRALEKDPARRPESAEVLLEALDEWKRRRAAEIQSRRPAVRARRWATGVLGCAVLTLAVLWASPWGRVEMGLQPVYTLSSRPEAGPSGTVHGFWYEDARVYLEIEAGGKPWIKVGDVEAGGEFRLEWPDKEQLARALGSENIQHGRSFPAAVVSQRLGRTVRTPPFTIQLDYELPKIVSVEGSDRKPVNSQETDDGRRISLPDCEGPTLLAIRASERLRADSRVIVPSRPSEQPDSISGDTISFDAAPEDESVTLILVDMAGNSAETRLRLSRVPKPNFLEPAEGVLRIHEKEHQLRIRVEGNVGTLRALTEGSSPSEVSGNELTVPISFRGARGVLERREVTLRAWSVSSDPSGDPDAERTVIIERLERELRLEYSIGEGPPRLHMLDAEKGGEVPWSRISASATLRGTPVEGIRVGDEGLVILPPGLRGKVECVFTAEDAFGNESAPMPLEIVHPRPPEIAELRLEGDLGTKDVPLHSRDCTCRPREGEGGDEEPVVLHALFSYVYPEDLEWEIERVNGRACNTRVGPPREGRLEIAQVDLLGRLVPGENVLDLSVYDPQDEDNLHASERLTVHVARIDTTVYPPEGLQQVDSRGHVGLRIDVRIERGAKPAVDARGSKIDGVDVFVEGKPASRTSGTGEYAFDVPVALHDETHVRIRVEAGGRTHEVERVYHREPVEKIEYRFRVGPEKVLLPLRFCKTSSEGQAFDGFWFSDAGLGEELHAAFAGGAKGGALLGGVTRDEADSDLSTLERSLRSGKSSDRVRLPSESEMETLARRELISPRIGALEWLEGSLSGPDAVYGEWGPDGLTPKRAYRNQAANRAGFRIVIEYGASGTDLVPRNAEASSKVKG